jgi:hypothetical protein
MIARLYAAEGMGDGVSYRSVTRTAAVASERIAGFLITDN